MGLGIRGSLFCPFVLGRQKGQKLTLGWLAATTGDVSRSPSSVCLRCCLLHNRPKNNPKGGHRQSAPPAGVE
jgi:hypothetical protein